MPKKFNLEWKLGFINFISLVGLNIKKIKFNDSKSDLKLELESRKSEEILEIFTAVHLATFEEFWKKEKKWKNLKKIWMVPLESIYKGKKIQLDLDCRL